MKQIPQPGCGGDPFLQQFGLLGDNHIKELGMRPKLADTHRPLHSAVELGAMVLDVEHGATLQLKAQSP